MAHAFTSLVAASAVLAAALPATARPPGDVVPAEFRGVWETDLARCADQASETRVVIADREVAFFQHGGTPRRVRRLDAHTVRIEARTGDDMGHVGSSTWIFRLSSDGGALTRLGAAEGSPPLYRCPGQL